MDMPALTMKVFSACRLRFGSVPATLNRPPICQQWVSATSWRGGTRRLRTSSANVSDSGRILDRPGGPGRLRRVCAEIARRRLRRWRKPSVSNLNCRSLGSSSIIRLSARLIARSMSRDCARRALNNGGHPRFAKRCLPRACPDVIKQTPTFEFRGIASVRTRLKYAGCFVPNRTSAFASYRLKSAILLPANGWSGGGYDPQLRGETKNSN